jgi:hypothetical protein
MKMTTTMKTRRWVPPPHHPYPTIVNETQLELEKLLVMACPPCSLATT